MFANHATLGNSKNALVPISNLSFSPPHPNNTKIKNLKWTNDDLGPLNAYCSRDSPSVLFEFKMLNLGRGTCLYFVYDLLW
jgi:hypothetical protein